MSILFIAEKPSVAIAFAQALSPKFTKKEGYIEGENQIYYTWAYGHLVGLKEPKEIREEWATWQWKDLPLTLHQFSLSSILKPLNADAAKQLKIMDSLGKKVSKIYNACDCAIEGELIFHLIDTYIQLTKRPTYRVWTSSLNPETIRQAVRVARPDSEYRSLKEAGLTRMLSDWHIGLNATRAFTLLTQKNGGNLLALGRVMTPVLSLVYNRHLERTSFHKLFFYPIRATFHQKNTTYHGFLQGERIIDKAKADYIVQKLQDQQGIIRLIQDQQKSTAPPLLFDLTAISKLANQKHGYRATETLQILQKLYEKKLVTYPRTTSSFITEAELPLMYKSFDVLQRQYKHYSQHALKERVHLQNKRVVNPDKVEDHHCILPEPTQASGLDEKEQNIYNMIIERFFMQFHDNYQYQHRIIETEVLNDYLFRSSYKQEVQKGWKHLLVDIEREDDSEDLEGLPQVTEGSATIAQIQKDERETKPPAAYTDGTLMEVMKNISLRVEDTDMKEVLKENGIGTPATRAYIIEKLVKVGYLSYSKKSLVITDLGISIVEMLRKTKINLLTSPELTAKWEIELERIKKGASADKFKEGIQKFTHLIIEEAKAAQFVYEEKAIAHCPCCKSKMKESPKTYYCENKEACSFFLWRVQFGKTITNSMLDRILSKGQSTLVTLKSQKGDSYKAYLVLQLNEMNGRLLVKYK